jgi:hypothetical protein
VAYSSCCIPFLLDASDSILSTSSSSCSTSYAGFFSSSTFIVVFSYYVLRISSTSTIVGISCVPDCGTRVLLRMFCPILLGVPTLGGDMLMKSGLQTFKSPSAIKNSPSLAVPLGSAFYALENNTLSCPPPPPLFATL